MSRYRGPRLRITRRLGTLPGFTTKTTKRKQTPGDHGKEQGKKIRREKLTDDYKSRLIEKQKLRYNYGVTERQMISYMAEAKRRVGSTEINLLKLLELRLDCIIFRLGFARTIPEARQMINHGHITVNNKKVTIPSFECKIGDLIQAANKQTSQNMLSRQLARDINFPEHIKTDKKEQNGKLIKNPNRKKLDLEINELKVIEYYSR